MSPDPAFEIIPVWKKVGTKLSAELVALWEGSQVLSDRDRANQRAREAVCVVRDASGTLRGVGTAVVRVLPRLRQPLYYYRQFFAPELRGAKLALPFFNEARRLLEAYNESLPAPESIGMLLELENQRLVARYERAYEPAADSTFIGYSPAGLQLRVSYFKNARLLQPVSVDAGAIAKCA